MFFDLCLWLDRGTKQRSIVFVLQESNTLRRLKTGPLTRATTRTNERTVTIIARSCEASSLSLKLVATVQQGLVCGHVQCRRWRSNCKKRLYFL